jgi:hypothetical protein
MTNNGYLSIVSKDCGPAELLVRARRAGDIEKLFPNAKVTRQTNSDYLYRAILPRDVVKQALVAMIDLIDSRTSRIVLKTGHCMLRMSVSGVQWQDYNIRRRK